MMTLRERLKHRLQRFHFLYSQFHWPLASAFVIVEAARTIFDPYRFVSYSQFGEDRVIHQLLDVNQKGFYVDVGSNHPLWLSNTLALYQNGWRGICIDANPDLVRLFSKRRPRDICQCAAVSNTQQVMQFNIMEASVVSFLGCVRDGSKPVRQITVQTQTLQQLFEEFKVPKDFELLSVDCEWHDFEVVSSFDIKQYRPKVIVVEMHGFDFGEVTRNPIWNYLNQNGYVMNSYVWFSGIFVERQHLGRLTGKWD